MKELPSPGSHIQCPVIYESPDAPLLVLRHIIRPDFDDVLNIESESAHFPMSRKEIVELVLSDRHMGFIASEMKEKNDWPLDEEFLKYIEERRRHRGSWDGSDENYAYRDLYERKRLGWMAAGVLERECIPIDALRVLQQRRRQQVGSLLLSGALSKLTRKRKYAQCLIESDNKGANNFLRSHGFRASRFHRNNFQSKDWVTMDYELDLEGALNQSSSVSGI